MLGGGGQELGVHAGPGKGRGQSEGREQRSVLRLLASQSAAPKTNDSTSGSDAALCTAVGQDGLGNEAELSLGAENPQFLHGNSCGQPGLGAEPVLVLTLLSSGWCGQAQAPLPWGLCIAKQMQDLFSVCH